MNSEIKPSPPDQRTFVRCHSCRAIMTEGLSRCPHCGQLTVGTERTVSQFEMTHARKTKAAERRINCKTCGKPIPGNKSACPTCEGKHHSTTLLMVLLGVVLLVVMLMYIF